MTQQRRGIDGLAWAAARAAARDLPVALPPETLATEVARGRVLAEPIRAATAVPGFDNAAMDGYAVAGPGPWTIVGLLLAGHAAPEPPRFGPGTAVEIATGAVIPAEAEAVLPYEDCRVVEGVVHGTRGPRMHIRRAGDDVRVGDLIVPAGRAVTATVAAAATQGGVERVCVHAQPTVTLLVTGDEVVLDGRPGPGQVRDSFTGIVGALTERGGGRLHTVRHVGDDLADLTAALDAAATDVVVVSGSSSAGAADHLQTLLDERDAEWHVRGVACRPGHPQGLAALPGGRWVVSLPGNPYAGLVSALTLLEPLLEALAGRPPEPLTAVPVSGAAKLVPGGVRIVPVRRRGAAAELLPATGSAGLAAAAAADALAVLPDDWTDGGAAGLLTLP